MAIVFSLYFIDIVINLGIEDGVTLFLFCELGKFSSFVLRECTAKMCLYFLTCASDMYVCVYVCVCVCLL